MPKNVDQYLSEGCGRCEKFRTPDCKVHFWRSELVELRAILLDVGHEENIKWGQPCYSIDGKNVVMIYAFRAYFGLGFFKGSLMDDPENLLISAGKNSQASKQMRFENANEIVKKTTIIKSYLAHAIAITKTGQRVEFSAKNELEFSEELLVKFEEDPTFHEAFMALSLGRRRGYHLFFSGAKQSETRVARIEKHVQNIMQGLGIHDRYRQGIK